MLKHKPNRSAVESLMRGVANDLDGLKAAIRLLINQSVAFGNVSPEDALAAIMSVAATYVAQVRDDTVRATYVATIAEMFGTMVSLTRGDPAPGINIVKGPEAQQ